MHDIETEIEIMDDRAELGCGSFHQDVVVRVHSQPGHPRQKKAGT
jgi:hypothetical protein